MADWVQGREIDLRGRKKVLRAAGLASRSGDSARQFAGFSRFLQRDHGYCGGDFLDATYAGLESGDDWTPRPYDPEHVEASLTGSVENLKRLLRWYDQRLPIDLELHLVGFSLGGVVLLQATSELLDVEAARWRVRLASVITVASPHFGTDLKESDSLLGWLGLDKLVPGQTLGELAAGVVGRELVERAEDPGHRAAVLSQAARLKREGVELLTLADDLDSVVRPAEAVIAPEDERQRFVLETTRASVGGERANDLLGHGPLLDNPRAWRLMAEVIGPQEPR